MGNKKSGEVEVFYSKPLNEHNTSYKKIYLFEVSDIHLSIFKGYIFEGNHYNIKYESCEYEFKRFYKGSNYNRPLKIKKIDIKGFIEYLKPIMEDETFFTILLSKN